MTLTAEQVEQYHRDGYVCPVPVMPAAEALQLRRQLEAVEARQGGKLEPAQRSRAFLLFKWLDDLIRDPRVLDPVEQLIGPDILCWSTIFWIKDSGSKSFVGWHQDNMLTRGQVIPGLDESRAVYMPLRAGEMSLHNYCLAHGSGPNISPDRRIGVSMHFMPPGTKQVVGAWDCAALVRGEDRFGNFALAPKPVEDFDPEAVAFHAQAAKAMRDVLYAGAEKKLGRL
jgi:non-haem Fe2+, alpha-ketoglutarate-dependent halogenase